MGSPIPIRLTRQTAVLAVVVFSILSATLFVASSAYFPGATSSSSLAALVPSVSWNKPQHICSRAKALDDINKRWGKIGLDMTVAHSGSGMRMRLALSRLVNSSPGDKFIIGVVGGSVTFGHGLQPGDTTWTKLLKARLKELYPDVDIDVVNGAVPATGTDYFAHCYSQHIPSNSDIFIDEGAVNDIYVAEYSDRNQKTPIINYAETLMRDWLRQSTGTAALMLSTFFPVHNYINGADRHAIVSEYYDIPRLSTRPFLYPYLLQNVNETSNLFAHDGHPNQAGHYYIADIVLRYLLRQICMVEAEEERASSTKGDTPFFYPGASKSSLTGPALNFSLSAFEMPKYRISQKFDDKNRKILPEVQASCLSANVVVDGVQQLKPSKVEGFETTSWNNKHYWSSNKPGSFITFDNIHVSSGNIGLYYLRQDDGVGDMKCWVDNQKNKARTIVSFWTYVSVGSLTMIADGLTPGTHSLTCEVLSSSSSPDKGTQVRIIAVVAT